MRAVLPKVGAHEPGGVTSALWGQAKIVCAPIIYARMSELEDMPRHSVHHDRGVSRPTPSPKDRFRPRDVRDGRRFGRDMAHACP
jgi:hypothetical protein